MNQNQVTGILRIVLGIVGGLIIQDGKASQADWESISGGALALAMVIWSYYHHGKGTIAAAALPVLLLLLSGCLLPMGCISSTMNAVQRHDTKVIQTRLEVDRAGGIKAMAGVDLLSLLDTGFWASLKADPWDVGTAIAADTGKTALGAGVLYFAGKEAGWWGQKDSSSAPTEPSMQIQNNGGTVNVAGGNVQNTQTTSTSAP